MGRMDLSDTELELLRLLQDEGSADLYALANAAGMGPRAVQEALQRLTRDGLVDASDRGASFRCTNDGQQAVLDHEASPPQDKVS